MVEPGRPYMEHKCPYERGKGRVDTEGKERHEGSKRLQGC